MNPSVLEIFAADARKYAARLREAIDSEGEPQADAVRRAARRLHHSAVLANHEPVAYFATALQKTAVQVIAGKREWSDQLRAAVGTTLEQLDAVVEALPGRSETAESALKGATDGLVGRAPEPPKPVAAENGGDGAAAAAGEDEAELTILITELGSAVERLENDPRDRQPLKSMLRRIRRLRELGRIEVLSPQDKALNAVEELILQIADLNATVGPGYLTVFRHAREVLEQMRAGAEGGPSVTQVGGRAVEVDRLKDKVMEKVRRSRVVIWVSDLFFATGPHIVACPVAEEQAGSMERYFLTEATGRLDRSENLRKTMLAADPEQMRLAGESLAHTLRHLRERAVAFNHGRMGRVARRAAAALRAQLVRPPATVRAMAAGFGQVFAELRIYVETEDAAERAKAAADAEAALENAIAGGGTEAEAEEPPDPDEALQQALALRTRVDERLRRLKGVEADGLREDLDKLFDLVAHYMSVSGEHQ